jgi:hypothetical protein
LTDAQRADIHSQSSNIMQSALGNQLALEQEYGGLAERYGIPSGDVAVNFVGKMREGLPEVTRPPQVGAEQGQGFLEQGRSLLQEGLAPLERALGGGQAQGAPTQPQADAAAEAHQHWPRCHRRATVGASASRRPRWPGRASVWRPDLALVILRPLPHAAPCMLEPPEEYDQQDRAERQRPRWDGDFWDLDHAADLGMAGRTVKRKAAGT